MAKVVRICKIVFMMISTVGIIMIMKYCDPIMLLDILHELQVLQKSYPSRQMHSFSNIFNRTQQSLLVKDPPDYIDEIESQGLTIWITYTCRKSGDIVNDAFPGTMKKIIPFSVLYITIKVTFSHHCSNSMDLVKVNPPQNYTIGLGHNHILVRIYKSNHSKLQKLNIHIFRQDRILPQLKKSLEFLSTITLKRCILIQSCAHIIDESKPCNIFEPDQSKDWIEFLIRVEHSKTCSSTKDFFHQDSYWSVPCIDCNTPETCLWEQSIWTTPSLCSITTGNNGSRSQEIKSTKIFFIGDSTIRGLYYSLLEHLNGSLHQWSKSHSSIDVKISNLINVSLGYSYYPRFWEKEEDRPGLINTLKDMVERLKYFDSEEIIFIIGGVQWLNENHLNEIKSYFSEMKNKPQKLHVIIKEFGAGFHVPASFITYKPKRSRLQLTMQNAQLVEAVSNLGFHILPSYRLTWSRLEEFYPGTCACHFHAVEILRHSLNIDGHDPISTVSYRIIGSIHKTYFDMLKLLIYNITNKIYT